MDSINFSIRITNYALFRNQINPFANLTQYPKHNRTQLILSMYPLENLSGTIGTNNNFPNNIFNEHYHHSPKLATKHLSAWIANIVNACVDFIGDLCQRLDQSAFLRFRDS